VANTWATGTPMPTARYSHAAAAVGGKLYAIGGLGTGDQLLDKVEEYNPVLGGIWTIKPPMPAARQLLAWPPWAASSNVIGGCTAALCAVTTVDEYDPVNDNWTPKRRCTLGVGCIRQQTLGGKIYVIGGADSNFNSLTRSRNMIWSEDVNSSPCQSRVYPRARSCAPQSPQDYDGADGIGGMVVQRGRPIIFLDRVQAVEVTVGFRQSRRSYRPTLLPNASNAQCASALLGSSCRGPGRTHPL